MESLKFYLEVLQKTWRYFKWEITAPKRKKEREKKMFCNLDPSLKELLSVKCE